MPSKFWQMTPARFLSLFIVIGGGCMSATAAAGMIENFRIVSPGIYAGVNPIDGPEGEAAFQELVKLGIKLDIDLQGTDVAEAPNVITRIYNEYNEPGEKFEQIEAERKLAESHGMQFLNAPINSNNEVTPEEETRINTVLDLLTKARADAPVYIHCEHGADRTGLVIALFRVLAQKTPIDQANAEWTRYGHSAKARLFTGELDSYFCKRVRYLGASETCGESD